jgi:hypothetical protein
MTGMCKIKLSKNHDLLNNIFSYYTVFLVYEQDEKEILNIYKIYEDELINQIINKNIYKNLLFYKYDDSIHISIIENNTIYNFIIEDFNRWYSNYF